MKSYNIFIFNFKKYFLVIILVLFTLSLILFSSTNISAAQKGLNLFLNNVFPSLFPFFIATELLSHTNIINVLSKKLTPIMRPLFNVPGEGAFALILGIISGYPTGAKIVTDFRKNNICTKEESERLLAFTNNSGPLFIIGTVGITLFLDKNIGFLLLFTHILASLTVGIIFRFWKSNKRSANVSVQNQELNFNNLGELIGNSIKNSLSTIFTIGGFIILFSVIVSILFSSGLLNIIGKISTLLGFNSNLIQGIIIGLVEVTNGVTFVSSIINKTITTNIIIVSFLLGFGGISVLLQVFSIISKTDISIKPYIIGKLIHGIISALYTYFCISFSYFSFLNL